MIGGHVVMFILSRCLSGCVGESFKGMEMTQGRARWGLGKGLAPEGGGDFTHSCPYSGLSPSTAAQAALAGGAN